MVVDPQNDTLDGLLRRCAENFPDRIAMIGEHRQWTWAELLAEVERVAVMWEDAGIGPGDPVAFVLNKRPEVAIGFLACARIGAIFLPVNFKLTVEQCQDQFRTAQVKAMVGEAEHDALLAQLAPLIGDRRKIFYAVAPGPHGDGFWDTPSPAGRVSAFTSTADTVCYYNYTSGSTGRPKGAITTHRNIIINGVATSEGLGFRPDDVYLGMFSVFAHPHELFHRSILYGGAFVIIDSLNPRIIAQAIEKHRITWMMAVPSFYEMLLEGEEHKRFDLSSLRVLESGGAYVSSDMLSRMESSFNAVFLPVWGSTETTGVGLGMPAGGDRKPGSTGRPIPTYSVRVVNEDGQDVAPNEVGELLIKGDAIALGYVNQPEETAAQFQDGWYATRDLVYRDEDGFLYFSGRRSEMLKIGGIRVFPLEIEQVIKLHPEVRDVVVVRGEDRLRGEIARAVVAVVPGSTLTVRKIQAFCRDQLASYKVPRVVEFWQEVPKLPNGKIDKKAVLVRPMDPTRDERA